MLIPGFHRQITAVGAEATDRPVDSVWDAGKLEQDAVVGDASDNHGPVVALDRVALEAGIDGKAAPQRIGERMLPGNPRVRQAHRGDGLVAKVNALSFAQAHSRGEAHGAGDGVERAESLTDLSAMSAGLGLAGIGQDQVMVRLVALGLELIGQPAVAVSGEARDDRDRDGEGKGRAAGQRQQGVAPAPSPVSFGEQDGPCADRPVGEEPPEFVAQLRGGGIAVLGVLGDRPVHDRMEIAQHGRLDPAQGPRLLLRHLADQGVPILGLEGGLLGQEFVEGQAQRIDIGAGVATALESLGRHVSDRAHDVTGTGQVAVAGDLRQAEVGDPDRAVGVEQEV